MFPHMFETNLCPAGYFTFLLGAVAVGVDSDIVMEISVDYYEAVLDGKKVLNANAWAREQNGTMKGIIQTVYVPVGADEQERIVQALNEDEGFATNLVQFIHLIERQHRG